MQLRGAKVLASIKCCVLRMMTLRLLVQILIQDLLESPGRSVVQIEQQIEQ